MQFQIVTLLFLFTNGFFHIFILTYIYQSLLTIQKADTGLISPTNKLLSRWAVHYSMNILMYLCKVWEMNLTQTEKEGGSWKAPELSLEREMGFSWARGGDVDGRKAF